MNIKKIEKIAKGYFKNASVCHDWSHVERVRDLALHIGRKEGADLQIIEIASVLHGIGRKEEFACKGKNKDGTKFCHAREGAKEAEKILNEFGFTEDRLKNIIHCIKTHRFRNEEAPVTLEAKILFDADKLDSIGAVGVARDFVFVGYFGTAMYTKDAKELVKDGNNYDYTKKDSAVLEFEKKLKYIKGKMQTPTGRRIAKERHKFMVEFFERFWEEINGVK